MEIEFVQNCIAYGQIYFQILEAKSENLLEFIGIAKYFFVLIKDLFLHLECLQADFNLPLFIPLVWHYYSFMPTRCGYMLFQLLSLHSLVRLVS